MTETEKKAMIVYRSCGSLDQYAPVVEEALKERGYSIEQKVFAAGTEMEEIKAWTGEHQSEIETLVIFYDGTVKSTIPEEIISLKRGETGFSLDQLLSEVTLEAYASSPRVKELEKRLYELQRFIGVSPTCRPTKGYFEEYLGIVKELYGLRFKEGLSPGKKADMKLIIIEGTTSETPTLLEHESASFKTVGYRFITGFHKKCAEAVKEGLEEVGIKCVIRSGLRDMTSEEIEEVKSHRAYLFCDRHVPSYKLFSIWHETFDKIPHESTAFMIPYFEDFRRWPVETKKEEMLDDPVRLMKEKVAKYISKTEG